MKIYNVDLIRDGVDNLPNFDADTPRAVGLGYFDGVHQGHQELIRRLVFEAKSRGLTPAIFTFDRFPKPLPPDASLAVAEALPLAQLIDQPLLMTPQMAEDMADPYLLTSPLAPSFTPFDGLLQPLSERIKAFQDLGVEELYLQSYNDEFVTVPPERFMDEILGTHLQAKLVVSGEDYSFGQMARGRVHDLRAWAEVHGVTLMVVPPVFSGDTKISSSAIRDAVVQGDLDVANRMLGRPYRMQGIVIHGKALGRTVGMPTANTRVPEGQAMPPFGVYLTRTKVDGRYYPSVTNIGMRPTVNQTDPKPLLETCLIDVKMDLYDKLLDVDFLRFMRPEEKYPSFLAMSAQIAQDIEDARALHQSFDQPWDVERDPETYRLSVHNSERFSQCTLDVVFQAPATPERLAAAQLLSRVLTATTEQYPTRAEVGRVLDYHYGLTLDEDVYMQGDLATIAFHVSGVRRGLDGSRPFQFGANLLMDMILNPYLNEEGFFPESIVETARQNLLMERRSFDQDREASSIRRAWVLSLEEGDPRALNSLGDPSWIRAIGQAGLVRFWKDILKDWEVNVYLSGVVSADTLDQVRTHLKAIPVSPTRFRRVPGVMPSPCHLLHARSIKEHHAGEQAMVVMIYGGLPAYNSLDMWTGRVLNMLIGGGPHAELFEVVREQKALCYSIDSHIAFWKQAIVIQSRLYPDDVDEAIQAIKDVIARIAAGDIDDKDWVSARMLVEAEVLTAGDAIMDMGTTLNLSESMGIPYNLESAIEAIRQVAKDDLVSLAQNLQLMTTYVQVPDQVEVQA